MISVVIPVRNGAAHLPEQLAALAAQTHARDWEVIVADNGSTDDTRARALAMDRILPRLRVVDASGRVGVSHARNVGAAAAQGEVIVFCDADDRVDPDWLDAIATAIRDADVVGGTIDWSTLNAPGIARPGGAETDGLLHLATAFLPFASGANCAVRASVFRALDGFDERFTSGGDDVEFFWRVQLAGYRLAFAPAARVAYRERATSYGSARQAYLWARQGPHLFREFRSRGMPRSSVRAAAHAWLHLVVRAPTYWSHRARRRQWIVLAAARLGRLAGSVRFGVLYL